MTTHKKRYLQLLPTHALKVSETHGSQLHRIQIDLFRASRESKLEGLEPLMRFTIYEQLNTIKIDFHTSTYISALELVLRSAIEISIWLTFSDNTLKKERITLATLTSNVLSLVQEIRSDTSLSTFKKALAQEDYGV